MKKFECLFMIIIVLAFCFTGCATKSLPTSVVGQWDLETISDTNGTLLAVGKAYNDYDDFGGQKSDLTCVFKEDGTFAINSSEENLQGEYSRDDKKSTTEAIAITLHFDDEIETTAVYGIKKYQDDIEVGSITFTLNEKIYSFIK